MNPTLFYILASVVLSTGSTAMIGNFWFLQKKSLVGDVVSHALLPGICLGFLWTYSKINVYLMIGAFLSGIIALFLLEWLNLYTKIKKDSAMAFILSAFLGIGLFLLAYIQQSGSEHQAGLKQFLWGHVATLMYEDMFWFVGLAFLVIVLIVLFFKPFTILSFDPLFARTIGYPVRLMNGLLQALTLLTIVAGIHSMGTLLVASILIVPAATAHFWTDRLPFMMLLSALIAICASIGGTLVSYWITDLPTGPCIVLFMIFLAVVSFFIAPAKGLVVRKYKAYRYQEKILIENVLKLFYELGQAEGDYGAGRSIEMLLAKRSLPARRLKKALQKLLKKGLIARKNDDLWALTASGKAKGAHILSLHTLWEAYLMHYVKIQPDHVHDDAESIEHFLTPELERDLRRLLEKY